MGYSEERQSLGSNIAEVRARIHAELQTLMTPPPQHLLSDAPPPDNLYSALSRALGGGTALDTEFAALSRQVQSGDQRVLAIALRPRDCAGESACAVAVFVICAYICRGLSPTVSDYAALRACLFPSTVPSVAPRPQLALLVATAAAYHRLIHEEAALTPLESIKRLRKDTSLDQESLRRMLCELTPFPPGMVVSLNDGRSARVRAVRRDFPMSPTVEILDGVEAVVDLHSDLMVRIGMDDLCESESVPSLPSASQASMLVVGLQAVLVFLLDRMRS